MSNYHPLPLPFWKRYVDDTLTALPQDKVQHFHQHLNSIETTIQFTVEMESESTLPFLDTRITHHPNGSLLTTVLRKSTHTDKYLDFQSHHPLAHKVAVARTLFDRTKKICSDFPDLEKEKELVAPEQWLPQKTCNEELATTTTARARPTHSHSHPTVRPSSI